MKRMLSFITLLTVLLGIAAITTRKPVENVKRIPRVGILQLTSHPALDAIHKGIIASLKAAGYRPGKTVEIDFQNAENDQSNLKSMAEKFAAERVNVAVGIATPAAQSLANTLPQTPVVMGAITDPIAAKLVTDVKHPGGQITGVSDQAPIAAQLKLMKTLVPNLKTIGVIATSSDDSAQTQAKQFARLAEQQGLTAKRYAISSTNDVAQVGTQMVSHVDAVYVPTDNTVASAMQTLISAADQRQVPVFPAVDTMVKQGGVATIGIDQYQLGIETGKIVAAILAGKAPGDIPVHFEQQGQLILNLQQAKKLGIQIPAELLKQAQQDGKVIK